MDKPKLVVIGGGTGSYTLLQGLKLHTPHITALVNMADDGGSTGVLRDELGVLPPGDVRQCLVALSSAPQELRELFNFRFPSGSSLSGHSFGNIFLSAVEKMTSNFEDAVRMASEVLQITGRVLPVSLDDCQLVLESNGQRVVGQRSIELTNLPPHAHPTISFERPVALSSDARQAISEADLVVIAPGILYSSLAPALIVEGLTEALQASSAPVAFVCNLVNKPNHTMDFSVHEYAVELERLTAPGIIDYVLYNTDTPSPDFLEHYALEQEYPVRIDSAALEAAPYKSTAGAFLSRSFITRNPNDSFIKRSLIRHDGTAIAAAIMALLE